MQDRDKWGRVALGTVMVAAHTAAVIGFDPEVSWQRFFMWVTVAVYVVGGFLIAYNGDGAEMKARYPASIVWPYMIATATPTPWAAFALGYHWYGSLVLVATLVVLIRMWSAEDSDAA